MEQKIFLVCGLREDMYDFQELQQYMLACLDDIKRTQLCLNTTSLSKMWLDEKVNALDTLALHYALGTVASAMSPANGTAIAVFVSVLTRFGKKCTETLGLDTETLEFVNVSTASNFNESITQAHLFLEKHITELSGPYSNLMSAGMECPVSIAGQVAQGTASGLLTLWLCRRLLELAAKEAYAADSPETSDIQWLQ
eukprot:TRINITY_DN11001_c0_g1_i1.p1 TRINITY_DN11001_c0_g1~~TRINITY_DN11001_c0_g1_i1.p1  ORF type:complete len:197 (+),score=26.19 TRINITY_DN11001_c0_g1_i1:550-1140(+)